MKKIVNKVCFLVLLLLLTAGLAACSGEQESTEEAIGGFALLEGTWTNSMGDAITFPLPNTKNGEVWQTPNGAYILEKIWLEGGEERYWVFPVGVEMVRYNLLGERMPYNPEVASDTSQVRMLRGDFEVTACCTDEFVNEQLFTRER